MLGLTVKQFWAYANEAGFLSAESQLMALEAACFPHMRKADQNKVHYSYVKALKADQTEKEKRRERKAQFKLLKSKGLLSR